MTDVTTLTLLCPGLLDGGLIGSDPAPRVPTLERWLARADRVPAPTWDAAHALLAAFGLDLAARRDAPSAPFSRLGEALPTPEDGYWLHAEPVHLHADRDQLLLFSGADLAPSRDEADALVALFNQHLADEGLSLSAPRAEHWYLRSERPLDLETEPLARVVGGPLPLDAPSGADARRWRALMNEVQMLFFDSAVNRRREQLGRPLISGVWTWGGGMLAGPPAESSDWPDLVIGDDPLTMGLARWSGVAHRALDDWDGAVGPLGHCIVLWDRLALAGLTRDPLAWGSALVDLDQRLATLEPEIKRGAITQVTLAPGEGSLWRVTRPALRRFWRRPVRSRWSISAKGVAPN